jgi:hypothetical protein
MEVNEWVKNEIESKEADEGGKLLAARLKLEENDFKSINTHARTNVCPKVSKL